MKVHNAANDKNRKFQPSYELLNLTCNTYWDFIWSTQTEADPEFSSIHLKSFGSFHIQAVILCGCDLCEFGFIFFINFGIYLICKVQKFTFTQFEINHESKLQHIQAVILLNMQEQSNRLTRHCKQYVTIAGTGTLAQE